jgi:lipoate-protein ligase B
MLGLRALHAQARKDQDVLGTRCTLVRPGLLPYSAAYELQQGTAARVREGADPALILLEHPPTYTLGVRGREEHLLPGAIQTSGRGAEVVRTNRGGDVTFHGPGQLVAYPIFDLRRLGLAPVSYVRALEAVLIDICARFGVEGERVCGRPGVWTGGAKIAALGVRISRGVTTHGFALNVSTDLSYFADIVPCGIIDAGVTSIERETGTGPAMRDVEEAAIAAFEREFGLEITEPAMMEAAGGR